MEITCHTAIRSPSPVHGYDGRVGYIASAIVTIALPWAFDETGRIRRLPKLVRSKVERDQPAEAANDNGLAWPLLPFPEDWHADC